MLFGESGDGGASQVWWVAALIPITSAVTALAAAWWQARKQGRADALKEWQQIVEKLEAKDATQETEIKELQKARHSCELENVGLKGEIRLMQASLRRLQVATGDTPPVTSLPGMILCDVNGIVKMLTPALVAILHWFPKDLIGKNVEAIIPERFKEKHRAGMKKIKETGQPPWSERTIIGYGLTKEGDEVPVSINLSAWKTDGGEWLISAEIRQRYSAQGEEIPKPNQPMP